MKKIMILALALTLAFSFTACGGGGETPPAPEPVGGNGETPSAADSSGESNAAPPAEGRWVLVSTETALYDEDDADVKFSGENGNFEAVVTADGKSGSTSANITEPPSEIFAANLTALQIGGGCSSDFPSDWECNAFIRISGNLFSINNNAGYSHYSVDFGTGGGLDSSNSEIIDISAGYGGPGTEKTAAVTIGLYTYHNNISTTYNYEWQKGD